MAVAIAAAVLSISTMGDATAVEAFLVFSKCVGWASSFDARIVYWCITATIYFSEQREQLHHSKMGNEKLKFLDFLQKNVLYVEVHILKVSPKCKSFQK